MPLDIIATSDAPAAIGPYSQAVSSGGFVFLSGQIPLDPATGKLVEGDIATQTRRVFRNLEAVCKAAGGDLSQLVRVGVFLQDLGDFTAVNDVMAEFFSPPYPSRATVEVAALPRGARVEIDGILALA